ncbi:MAG TPA: hypothetical protein VK540_27615 [Polyangiaceae bacterium]|nr:hypothetical protein [Polyangiaceae bacterium]
MVIGCIAVLAGCSSEGDILPSKVRFTPSLVDSSIAEAAAPDVVGDDGSRPRDPNANCVKPGTPRNERGVGGYCEPGRNDCESDAGPRFCTADYRDLTPIDDDKWFCSTLCTMDQECGTGAFCIAGTIGSGCSPFACRPDASM